MAASNQLNIREESTHPNTDFFRYLQLRNLLTKHKELYKVIEPTPIEEFIVKRQRDNRNKTITGHIYQIFIGMNPNDTL